jgi:hypothetical protein
VRGGDDGVPAQVVVQRHRVDGGVDVAGPDQRWQRAGEPQPAGRLGQVQRLDAEAVAGQHQPAGVALVDRQGEHADEVVDEVLAPAVVGLRDDLGVGRGEEPVAVPAQLVAQLAVVVDAAVEDDGQPQLGVDHRLVPVGREVDDGQPAVAEGQRSVRVGAGVVGSTRHHGVAHEADRGEVGGAVVEPEFTGETAHVFRPYPPSSPDVCWRHRGDVASDGQYPQLRG